MGAAPSSSSSSPISMASLASDAGGGRPFGSFAMRDARAIVDGIPEGRRIVLLGESTHGTEEFYRTRAAVTKRLIEERGFTCVCFEADFPYMAAAEKYTRGRRATPFPLDGEGGRFPVWMWGNQCMSEWFDWCKDRESVKPKSKANAPVSLFGIDCYSLFESKRAVVSFLERHDPEFATEAVNRLAFLDKFKSGHEYGEAAVNGNLSRIAGHLQDVLTKIQARLQWGSDKYECAPAERLAAEQNCEVIIAADEYYRKCVSEPAGSQASWNARDQHMTTTLLRIQAHLGDDTKIVVWAHNSHVGDSTATNRGGDSFERNETWNLGQMVRATFGAGNVWIVGQYTYGGQVMAAEHWGGKHLARELRDALPGSYEAAMHGVHGSLVKTIGDDSSGGGGDGGSTATSDTVPFFFHTAPFHDPSLHASVQEAVDAKNPVAMQLVDMMTSKPARLQRWVGVSYKRDNERRAHYGELALDKCYDMIVFVDKTTALAPIAPKVFPAAPKTGGAAGSAGASKDEVVQSTRSVNKRLLKEYRRLMRSTDALSMGIEAHPLESNILEWHFVLRCSQAPYTGGEYHGTLTFPKEYPMRPPRFKVFTPSGRFEPGTRLCLSMSDYHPESWNPAWSVETLLVGLLSFMYEESNAIGSMSRSAREREKLAKKSHKFNRKDPIWREIFGGDEGTGYGATAGDVDDDDNGESVCRFCFTSEGELISPCMCKGSNEWVHLECLRKWQKEVLLTQPTHPKYHTSIDRICNICLEPFTGVGIPPSRHEQIRAFTGAELAAMVSPGNLLVSSREGSRENLELISKHPEIRSRLMTWTKAVFLMLSTGSSGGGGGLLAVSTSQPIDAPPRDAGISAEERALWAHRTRGGGGGAGSANPGPKKKAKTDDEASAGSGAGSGAGTGAVRVRHFDGGPLERGAPICVAQVANAQSWEERVRGIQAVPGNWIFGSYQAVAAVAEAIASGSSPAKTVTVNVVWGYGGWGGTQILAETARGGWGMVTVEQYTEQHPDADLEMDWLLDFEWSRIVSMARLAPKTEYTTRR